MTNSTVSDVQCIGPSEFQDKKLNDISSFDDECVTTGIRDNPFRCRSVTITTNVDVPTNADHVCTHFLFQTFDTIAFDQFYYF